MIPIYQIAALSKGQGIAQKLFFEQYGSVMFRVAIRYIKERPDAEDLVADAFIKIFEEVKKKKTFESGEHFLAWCKRIVINECLGFLRKKVNFSMLPETDFENELSIEANAITDLSAAEIHQLISKLPAGCQTVFNLYAIEGFTHEEISQKLCISVGTSKSQLSRARSILQQKIQQHKVLL